MKQATAILAIMIYAIFCGLMLPIIAVGGFWSLARYRRVKGSPITWGRWRAHLRIANIA